MKQTLLLKYADLAAQALLLVPLLLLISSGNRASAAICYLIMRTWQMLSCASNAITGTRPAARSRRLYGRMLIWVHGLFAIGVLLTLIPGPLPLAVFCQKLLLTESSLLLFLEPVMAIWYVMITLEEITTLRLAIHHRAEIHWKL